MPERRLQKTRDAYREPLRVGDTITITVPERFRYPRFLLSDAPEADVAEPTADTPWAV